MNQTPALRRRGEPNSPKNQTRLPPRFQRYSARTVLNLESILTLERKRPITQPRNARQLLAFQQFTAS